jgi:hypothetical protein
MKKIRAVDKSNTQNLTFTLKQQAFPQPLTMMFKLCVLAVALLSCAVGVGMLQSVIVSSVAFIS